jgi:hypothetical protein
MQQMRQCIIRNQRRRQSIIDTKMRKRLAFGEDARILNMGRGDKIDDRCHYQLRNTFNIAYRALS